MGRKILMVLLFMALLISLPVFSYADESDFASYTDITSDFVLPDLSSSSDYIVFSADNGSGGSTSYSFSNQYDYQFIFTSDSVASSVTPNPFITVNQFSSSSFWDGSWNQSGNVFTLTFNKEDWNYTSSPRNGYPRFYVSSFGTVSDFKVLRGTLKTEPDPHNIIVSSSSGGTASADVSSAVEGTTVNLTATPASGYQFDRWEVVSGGVTVSNNQFVMPDNEVVISAVFSPIQYSISVSSDGNGSVSSSVSTATAGTTVTLTATPAANYVFSEWQVLEGDIDIVNNQFIMPGSNVSVKAIFVPDGTHSVTVENDGNGVGSANPVRAEQGTRITLSAVPVLGYEFDSWEVVSGVVNISNNQFIMPDSDVVVRAKFKPIVYTITLNQGSNGSATVSQTTGIIGDVITLTATPDDLYSFSHWDVTQGGITVENNQFVMPASNVVLSPVFVEQSAISSGFEYHSGAISGEESVEFTTIDVDFGEQPSGEYLINIYHWGSGCIPTFQISYKDKYLPFSTTGGVSTVAIDHSGGELVLDGSLSLVKNLLQTAEGTIVWSGEYGNGNLQYHSVSSWTFNIEDVVLIPAGLSHVEDYGVYSAIVSFLRDKFDDLISVFGNEESEEDVNEAADELNKEVEDLNNLSGQLDEQKNDLEQQFNSDFKISDELSGQTGNIQLIYTGIFSSFGLFSIFIWLPVVLVVIKKLLRL